VVLSGAGHDGTAGAAAVKRMGGLVLAQDQATSRQFGMPGSAIAFDEIVNRVLALARIGPPSMSCSPPESPGRSSTSGRRSQRYLRANPRQAARRRSRLSHVSKEEALRRIIEDPRRYRLAGGVEADPGLVGQLHLEEFIDDGTLVIRVPFDQRAGAIRIPVTAK
jgi:hypothetical protein